MRRHLINFQSCFLKIKIKNLKMGNYIDEFFTFLKMLPKYLRKRFNHCLHVVSLKQILNYHSKVDKQWRFDRYLTHSFLTVDIRRTPLSTDKCVSNSFYFIVSISLNIVNTKIYLYIDVDITFANLVIFHVGNVSNI